MTTFLSPPFTTGPLGMRRQVVFLGFEGNGFLTLIMSLLRFAVKADTAEDMETKLAGPPAVVFVPATALGARLVQWVRTRWPGVACALVYRRCKTEHRRREAVAAMADGHECGAALIRATVNSVLSYLGFVPRKGMVLDNYELIGIIGSGGCGVVYRAVNFVTGRECALKVVFRNKKGGIPFRIEWEALRKYANATLECPHLARIEHVGVGPAELFLFYTMPLADNENDQQKCQVSA